MAAVMQPKTSVDLGQSPSLDYALKSLEFMEGALNACSHNPEEVYRWESTIKNTLIAQAYQGAKSNYELQLFRMQYNSKDGESFLKARDNFTKTCNVIEATAPVKEAAAVDIISAPANDMLPLQINGLAPISQTVQADTPAVKGAVQRAAPKNTTAAKPAVADKNNLAQQQKLPQAAQKQAVASAKTK